MKSHISYVEDWLQAMKYGLLNGRPYSENTMSKYRKGVIWFLTEFECLSVLNFKKALMLFPIESFSKRRFMYDALHCFGRYLVQESLLDEGFLNIVKSFRPRRHLPPKRLVVTQEELDRMISACSKPLDRMLVFYSAKLALEPLKPLA